MSELTSFLMDITILTILACNSITIFALRARIDELERREQDEADEPTERESE